MSTCFVNHSQTVAAVGRIARQCGRERESRGGGDQSDMPERERNLCMFNLGLLCPQWHSHSGVKHTRSTRLRTA
eukprot:365358-Chlamydomonas_euryale.AAC.3